MQHCHVHKYQQDQHHNKHHQKQAEVGGTNLPWELESSVRKTKIGDVMDVVGYGEYAIAHDEKPKPDTACRWQFFSL